MVSVRWGKEKKTFSCTRMFPFIMILELLGLVGAYRYCTYYSYGYNEIGSYCTYYSSYYSYRRTYVISTPGIIGVVIGILFGIGIFIGILVLVCCRRGRRSTGGVIVSGQPAQPAQPAGAFVNPTYPDIAVPAGYPGGHPPPAGNYGGNAVPAGYYGGHAAPAGYYGGNQPTNAGPQPPAYSPAAPR